MIGCWEEKGRAEDQNRKLIGKHRHVVVRTRNAVLT